MANVNAPFGFSQRQGTGSSPTYEQVTFGNGVVGGIDYNTAAIYAGDPVTREGSGDGTIKQSPGSLGASTVVLAGIFVGCKYLSTSQKRTVWSNYWPGSDVTSTNAPSTEAYVINDPNAQFLVQSDSTGVSQVDAGANFDFAIGTGNASNGLSGAYLLHTGATTTGYPFRLTSVVNTPPGAQGSFSNGQPYDYAIVSFANVETKSSTAGNT